jgi:hypothetical protein
MTAGSENRRRVRHSDRAIARLARCGTDAYPRIVVKVLFARVDRRIADLMLARARRRWPLLRLMPRTCVRQAILPAATVARQDVVRVVALAALVAGTLLVLIPAL